ncbi:MAG: zinc metalloprotease HtpX [Bacteroidota bacterium]
MRERIREKNTVQKYALVTGVFGLAAWLGSYWLGWPMALLLLLIGAAVSNYALKIAPERVLRWQGARHMDRHRYADLYQRVNRMASRAGLRYSPELYLVQSKVPNAFALGSKDRPVIGMTWGLARMLPERELDGVLAHEISHIKNNDLQVKSLAMSFGHMTTTLSFVGRFALLLTVPMMLMGVHVFSFWAILALIFSPALNTLLQLGLSRTMEFLADQDAAELTADPLGLASALRRIDTASRPWWRSLSAVPYQSSDWLKSHPDTKKRIAQLEEMAHVTTTQPSLRDLSPWNHPFFSGPSAWT